MDILVDSYWKPSYSQKVHCFDKKRFINKKYLKTIIQQFQVPFNIFFIQTHSSTNYGLLIDFELVHLGGKIKIIFGTR